MGCVALSTAEAHRGRPPPSATGISHVWAQPLPRGQGVALLVWKVSKNEARTHTQGKSLAWASLFTDVELYGFNPQPRAGQWESPVHVHTGRKATPLTRYGDKTAGEKPGLSASWAAPFRGRCWGTEHRAADQTCQGYESPSPSSASNCGGGTGQRRR